MPLRAVLVAGVLGLGPPPAPADAGPEPADDTGPTRGDAPATDKHPGPPPAKTDSRAHEVRAKSRTDPYGLRPAGAAVLSLAQIVRYALDNPLVLEAEQNVEAMRAQVKKADFAWIPVIETETLLMPGVRVNCQDVLLDNGTSDPFEFQYCYTGRGPDDRDFNINTVQDYFAQLADAGVRFEFRANAIIPITTFGKLRNTKRLARAGLTLEKLEKLQVEQETMLRVKQAHAALVLARQTRGILDEARKVVDEATDRVVADVGGGEEDWDDDGSAGNPDRDPDDLYRVRLAAVEVERLTRQAMKVESLALSALWGLAGKAAPQGFDIGETTLAMLPIDGGLQSLDAYKRMAVTQRPEARMASAAVKAREYQERLARANFLPDLGIVLRFAYARSTAADQALNQIYYQNGFNYSRLTAALGLRWRWDFHMKAFDLKSARATLRAAEYREEAARLLLGRDVETAYGDLVEAKHIVAAATEAAELSWKLVVSHQQKDSVGGGDAAELLRALKQWYEKRFELAEAIQSHNDALARLSRAVGTALDGPLPTASTAAKGP